MQLTMMATLFSTNLQYERTSVISVHAYREKNVRERVSYAQRFTMDDHHNGSGVSMSLTRYTSDNTLATIPLDRTIRLLSMRDACGEPGLT
jgi:hypothetical protein